MNTADNARVGPAADRPAPPEEEEGEAGGKEPAADATPGPSDAFRLLVTRREPAVKLQYAVSGLEPLAWSEDHRVSVSTARSIAVLELICDVHNPGQDLVIHRTSVPAPLNSCLLKVSHPEPSRGRVTGPRGIPARAYPGVAVAGKTNTKLCSYLCPAFRIPNPLLTHTHTPGGPLGAGSPSPRRLAGCWRPQWCFRRLHPLVTQPQTCLCRCSHCLGLTPGAPGWLCVRCCAFLWLLLCFGDDLVLSIVLTIPATLLFFTLGRWANTGSWSLYSSFSLGAKNLRGVE